MKNKPQQLDKLFAQVKQEKPLLSLEDVESTINTAPVSKGFMARHWPAIVSGLAIVAAGWIVTISQINENKPASDTIELNLSTTNERPAPKEELPLPKLENNTMKLEPNQAFENALETQPASTFKDQIDKINYLELQEDELEKIGIILCEDTLKVYFNISKIWASAGLLKCAEFTQNSSSLKFPKKKAIDSSEYKPYRLRYVHQQSKPQNNLEFAYADSAEFDYMVPIRIWGRYQGKTLEWIVWYDLSQELIEALPLRYHEELSAELNKSRQQLSSGFEEPTSCGYFETFCRDISIFDRIRVFPNPATTHMTANFETLEDCQLSVDLMNIEGQLVQNVFTGFINRGAQKIVLDVSNIEPDLYLLKFEASNGEYETMRVIIKR